MATDTRKRKPDQSTGRKNMARNVRTKRQRAAEEAVVPPKAFTTRGLKAGKLTTSEFILVGGKDGVGKTSFCISLLRYIEDITDDPEVVSFVIDTEGNSWAEILDTWLREGVEIPNNIVLYSCADISQVLHAKELILNGTEDPLDQLHETPFYVGQDDDGNERIYHRPIKAGDWAVTESMGSAWDLSQSGAYLEITGMTRDEYLSWRKTQKKAGVVTNDPERFWDIAKGHYDGLIMQGMEFSLKGINVLWSTGTKPPPQARGNRKENRARADLRQELGIDVGFMGSPALPYKPHTLVLLELDKGVVAARVLKDRKRIGTDEVIWFDIDSATDGGETFHAEVRS